MWVLTFWPVPTISLRGTDRSLSAPLSVDTSVLSISDPRDPLIPRAMDIGSCAIRERKFFAVCANAHRGPPAKPLGTAADAMAQPLQNQ
jgi:hypothetical protein